MTDPIAEVYIVERVLEFRSGGRQSMNVRTFHEEEPAKEYAKKLTEGIKDLLPMQIVQMAGQRQVRPTGMDVQQLIVNLGLTSFDHHVTGPWKVNEAESQIATAASAADEAGERVSDGGIILP